MRLKKVRFLVVDDQYGNAGYARVFTKLQQLSYLPLQRYQLQDNGALPMAYQILTPGVGIGDGESPFHAATRAVQQEHESFDFFVLDADLSQGDFLCEDDRNLLQNNYFSADTAGVYLYLLARKHNRPSILFTASPKAVPAVMQRTVDLKPGVDVVGEISSDGFGGMLEKALDTLFERIQRSVLDRISPVERAQLRALVEEARRDTALVSALTEYVIHDGDERWTVRTLFPKQSVTIETVKDGARRARALDYIDAVNVDIRGLIRAFMAHPKVEDFGKYGGMRNACVMLRSVDYAATGKAVGYLPMSQCRHFCKAMACANDRGAVECLRGFCDHTVWAKATSDRSREDDSYTVPCPDCGKRYSVAAYFRAVAGTVLADHEIKKLAQYGGYFPADLYYLCRIARDNARHVGGVVTCEYQPPFDKNLKALGFFSMKWIYRAGATVEHLRAAQEKLMQREPNGEWKLYDEGLLDLYAITVRRYGGAFQLRTGGTSPMRLHVDSSSPCGALTEDENSDGSRGAELLVVLPH